MGKACRLGRASRVSSVSEALRTISRRSCRFLGGVLGSLSDSELMSAGSRQARYLLLLSQRDTTLWYQENLGKVSAPLSGPLRSSPHVIRRCSLLLPLSALSVPHSKTGHPAVPRLVRDSTHSHRSRISRGRAVDRSTGGTEHGACGGVELSRLVHHQPSELHRVHMPTS